MENCDITACVFLWGAFPPFKNSAAPQSILDGLFDEKMFLVLFFSCLCPFSSTQIKTRGRIVKKIAATEKNSVISVLDAFLLAWSEKQTC